MTKVSFIIPTLNRGRFVCRAVASCVAAGEHAQLPFEVIVLDSQSDDGSWELLVEQFSGDERVLLKQNKRGLGPTRSWLDGGAFAGGEFVTFIWSDDYVAKTMLTDLLPAMNTGDDVVIGKAVIRDVEDDTPFPPGSSAVQPLDPHDLIRSYYGLSRNIVSAPVSPACALFSRRAFDQWRELVVEHADADLLVQQLMWRRAIGPDLLLFLVALSLQQKPVQFVDRIVTQFSSHGDSISISSPEWLLRGGYLAARVLVLQKTKLISNLAPRSRAEMLLRSTLQAIKLSRGIPDGVRGLEDKAAAAHVAAGYARELFAGARREVGLFSAAAMVAKLALTEIYKKSAAAGQLSMAPVLAPSAE